MDRLISLEPSNVVMIRVEPGKKCYGIITLRNVMYTMPIAFRLEPMNKARFMVRPQSGIISPLMAVTLEIMYHIPPDSNLPETFPYCDDSFLLHSVVAPGAAVKDLNSSYDSVPNDWFTTKKKQVFIDSGIKVMFVGSIVLGQLVSNGSMNQIRDVLEKSDPSWKAVDSVDENGEALLHIAISQNRPDLVQLLLEFEPDVESNTRSGSGSTPLETAAASGNALIVELLLAHRASTERSESSEFGPIHHAARFGHVDVLRLLLLKGANVDSQTKENKNTALHLAVKERKRDCVRLLLATGAKPDIRNGCNGNTPLHLAAACGDEHVVKLLLQKGANKDVRNMKGKTPYDHAAEHGNVKLFDSLRLGDSLCYAARKGEVRTINKLIENGAIINGRDQNGWTALHRAAFKGRLNAARVLIDNGIEIDAKDEDGYTALHCAVESGYVEVIELLVKRGAQVDSRTNKGVTPRQIAESLSFSGITRVLMNGGGGCANREGAPANAPVTAPALMRMNSSKGFSVKEEKDIQVVKKKKHSRPRVRRSSFDRSLPLTVV